MGRRYEAIHGRANQYKHYSKPANGTFDPKAKSKGAKSVTNTKPTFRISARLTIGDWARHAGISKEEYKDILEMFQLDDETFEFVGLGVLIPRLGDSDLLPNREASD